MSDLLDRALRHLGRLGHVLHGERLGFSSHAYVWRASADIADELDHRPMLYGVRVVVETALPPNTLHLDRAP